MPALRYYAEARQSALMHVSPSQAMSLRNAHLRFFRRPRRATRAPLWRSRSPHAAGYGSCTSARRAGSIEAKRAFERAYSLLDRVPQILRSSVLHGLRRVLCFASEENWTRRTRVAERTEALSPATGDPTVLACAGFIHGLAQHFRGRPRIAPMARERRRSAREARSKRHLRCSPPTLASSSSVSSRSSCLHLGFVDQGCARACARRTRVPCVRARGARRCSGGTPFFGVLMGEPERVRDVGEQLRALVDEYALEARAPHLWFRGWAEAHLGDPRAGYRLIREVCEQAVRLGIRAWGSETQWTRPGSAPRVPVIGARRGGEVLEETRCSAPRDRQRQYLTPLLLLELGSPMRSTSRRARESTLQAVAEARAQESLWFQVRALSALCEREDKTAEDVASLRLVLDQLTEGLDTAPVKKPGRCSRRLGVRAVSKST